MELINKVKVAIKQHKKYKKDVTKDLKKVVINKNIPLDDRWSLFIDSDLGFHETYIQRFNTIDLDPFYDRLEHRGITIDWDSQYINYPIIGEPNNFPIYCEKCDDYIDFYLNLDLKVTVIKK